MGGALTQPVTKKRSDEGQGLGLRYGLSSMQGWRPEMEDAHDVKVGLRYGLDDWSFFAVFDGHAGKYAAAFAAWNLLDFILRDSKFELETESHPHEPISIGPNGEKIDELQKDEEANPNSIQEHSDGVDKSKDPEIQKIIGSDPPPDSEPLGGFSETPKIQQETLLNNEHKVVPSTQEIEAKKAKFVSLPVLQQLEMVKNAIKSAFLNIDQSMRMTAKDISGCTAVCTLISPTHFFIANCGDSRAVLYDGKSPKFVTEDHKPFNPKERKRIIDAGGTATQRINNTLAVSRALGDFEFKKDQLRGPCEQLVSPEPEVTVIERDPNDEFLILACDGIWDVIDNDNLCQYVRYLLKIEPSLEKVCASVLDVCLHKGSRDNMSIIIVVFEAGPRVCNCEIERDKQNDEILLEFAESLYERRFTEISFPTFLSILKTELESQTDITLPPGVGIEAKYDLLREKFEQFADKNEDCE